MQLDQVTLVTTALSALTAAGAAVSLKFGGSMRGSVDRLIRRREERYARRILQKAVEDPGLSEEKKARIRLLIAEVDLLRATGLNERAKERANESKELVPNSPRPGGVAP